MRLAGATDPQTALTYGRPLEVGSRRGSRCLTADEHVRPRNVGILFFHEEPNKFLPGSQIDVVIFPKGPGGGEIIEKTFHGPLHEQVQDALRYLQNNVIREKAFSGMIVPAADITEARHPVES
jgi:predicted HTH transcriptional regulator